MIDKNSRPKLGLSEAILGLFLLISGLSLLIADNFWLGFYDFLKLLELAGLFLYVKYNFWRLFNLARFWQVFIASAAIQGIIGVVQFSQQKSLGLKFLWESPLAPDMAGVAKIIVGGEKIIRAYGLAPHPNILAMILMVAIFGVIYLFIKNFSIGADPSNAGCEIPRLRLGMTKKRIDRLLFAAVFVLLLAALFFTFSRSVILIGFASLIVWLLMACKSASLRKPILAIFILLFIVNCLLLIVFWPYAAARFNPADLSGSQSITLRALYNQTALDLVKESPFLGIGLGNFVSVFSQQYHLFQNWLFQPVHNIYLLIAAETGLLGLLAFLAFLFFTLKSVWLQRNNPFITYHLSLIAFLLVIGFTDHFFWTLQQGQLIFWLFLGILAAISHLEPRTRINSVRDQLREGSLANASKISPCSSAD